MTLNFEDDPEKAISVVAGALNLDSFGSYREVVEKAYEWKSAYYEMGNQISSLQRELDRKNTQLNQVGDILTRHDPSLD